MKGDNRNPMKRPKQLSAAFVRSVSRPGRYGDGYGGFGLSLLVKPMSSGRLSKSWSQRVRINGRPSNLGLGAYPIVTLAEARRKAIQNRRAIEQGKDPRRGGVPTFEQAVGKVIELYRKTWKPGGKSEAQWRASLTRYAMPKLGRMKVDKITTGDVLGVLTPIWNTKRVTAQRVRSRIGAIMKWAVAKGYREDNPAGDAIAAALPRGGVQKKHFPALPHGQVGAALETVRASGSWIGLRLVVEFMILTATRSGEARLATWEELDLEAATWTIPSTRMKFGRAHRVPLSAATIAVLQQAREIPGDTGLIFPSATGKTLSATAPSVFLHDLGIEAVPHGFRSSFRDWCSETGVDRAVAEAALAHVVKNKVEAAYARSDLFDRRRRLMADWAHYLEVR